MNRAARDPRVALQRRFDAIAVEHLRNEVERLSTSLDETTNRLYWAESAAESWRDDFEHLVDVTGVAVGMTVDGHFGALRDQHNVHGGVPAGMP